MTLGDVVQAHESALRFGGLSGIRSIGLIESAIARPYSGYYRFIYSKTAALTYSLAKNHGFVDGNKRTALLAMTLFLDRSGYRFQVGTVDVDIENMVLDVVENRLSFTELVDWFRERLTK
jgi:death-on-curing protein